MSYFGGRDFIASMCLAAVLTLEANIIHLEPKQGKKLFCTERACQLVASGSQQGRLGSCEELSQGAIAEPAKETKSNLLISNA